MIDKLATVLIGTSLTEASDPVVRRESPPAEARKADEVLV